MIFLKTLMPIVLFVPWVALVLTAVTSLSGCALLNAPARRIDVQAETGRMQPVAALAGTPVRAWLRQPALASNASLQDATLTIYIEGDGAEWHNKYQPPTDPTPDNPLTLRLAVRDPDARVAYLGRPCQYLEAGALARCPSLLWLSGRYGKHALTIMSAAIDILVLSTGVQRVRLVGYSGGGTMAALLAAHREAVSCLVTVASPLDTEAWASAIEVSTLSASLNPLAYVAALAPIAQSHFAAADDTIVPPATLQRFIDALPHARLEVIGAYDHDCCWVYAWQQLRQRSCLTMTL